MVTTTLRRALVGGLVAALGVGVGVTVASSSEDTIHGCYHAVNGNLRVVDAGDSCRPREQAIAWNEQGPQGEQGPPGEVGFQVISGSVDADGRKIGPNVDGFRSERSGPGQYVIRFDAGIWGVRLPEMAVTPLGRGGSDEDPQYVSAVVLDKARQVPGNVMVFTVRMVDMESGTELVDNEFMFVATAPVN